MLSLKQIQTIRKLAAGTAKVCPKKFSKIYVGMARAEFKLLLPVLNKNLRSLLKPNGSKFTVTHEVIYIVVNYNQSIPRCTQCGNLPQYRSESLRYNTYCSHECSGVSKARLANISAAHQRKTPEQKAIRNAKSEKTCLIRYGVAHPVLRDSVVRARYARKNVTINSEQYVCQGYEPYVLKDLESKIFMLRTAPSEMPDIRYNKKSGISSRYYPDAFIKTRKGTKVLLEVKSLYTLITNWETNVSKFAAATRKCGKNKAIFVLALTDGKTKTIYLKNPSAERIKIAYENF